MACLVLVWGLAGARAQEATRFDFGEVAQGAIVEHEFRLRNTGSAEAIRISGVKLTPPLQLLKAPAVVPPGQSVALRIKLDTSRLKGAYRGQLVVSLSGPGDQDREFLVEGRVVPGVDVLPLPAFFISTPKGVAKSASLEIVSREVEPLRLEVVKQPDGYAVALEPVEAGRRYRVTLTVPADAPAGRRKDRLQLKTSSKAKPAIFVEVNTIVRDRVHVFPDAVDFGQVRVGRGVQTLMVYQTGGKTFSVQASSDVPDLEIAAEPGPGGDRVQLTLTLGSGKPGPIKGMLVLRTNDRDFPELRVPVSGTVAGP
jgi:hypothetical protein